MRTRLPIFYILFLFFFEAHADQVNWSISPEIISEKGVNAFDPQIAIDSNGHVGAAWIENKKVKFRSKLANHNWSIPTTLSESDASAVRVVLDDYQNVTIVWIENGMVKAASKSLTGDWDKIEILSDYCSSSPYLAIDKEGNVIAAWLRKKNIETSTKLFGSNWQSKVTLNAPATANPIVNIGGSGSHERAIMVWQGESKGIQAIFYSTKFIKGNWSSPKVISEPEQHAVNPFVALDIDGNALAIWYTYDKAEKDYFNVIVKSLSFSSSKGTWDAAPTDLSLPGIANPEKLKACAAFDLMGNAITLWFTSFDNKTFALQSAIKPVNDSWSNIVDLANVNTHLVSADLSITSSGDLSALYMAKKGNSLTIQSIESFANVPLQWSAPITISKGTKNAYPKIVTSGGHTAAVWICNNGVNNQIAYLYGFR